MSDPLQPDTCAALLAALAAPERLRIIRFLRERPHNVGEIAARLQVAPVNVSHHMNVLRHAGLVTSKKHGRFVVYSLAPGRADSGTEEEPTFRLDLGCCRLELPAADARHRRGKNTKTPGQV